MSFTHLITFLTWHIRLQLYKPDHFHPQTSESSTFFCSYLENDKLIFRHFLRVCPLCTECRTTFPSSISLSL